MKVLIAVDSFKGSMSSMEASESIKRGIKKASDNTKVSIFPIADGGEGTCDAVLCKVKGIRVVESVKGPLGEDIEASYGIIHGGNTAIIEVASASGLTLVPKGLRNPLKTTSYGTGELIKSAINKGCKKIVIGLGGSATCDGGVGMLKALGARFLNKSNKEIECHGEHLGEIVKIDVTGLNEFIRGVEFTAASDVKNPLCGNYGASYIFAPQKGAKKGDVVVLDENLKHFGEMIKKEFNIDVLNLPGAGAAGGIGAAVAAFFRGKIENGFELISKLSMLEEKIKECDLVITGEGSLDEQTEFGKVPYGVGNLSKKYNKPVIAVCGSLKIKEDILKKCGIDAAFSIVNGIVTLDEAMEKAKELTEAAAYNIFKTILIQI